jgi:DNA-binding helix-hairpin-helix protein with protein kinase domain
MTTPDLFAAGQRLHLVKRIGHGGEGDVYLVSGESKKAVKVYKPEKRADREAKVRAMVRLRLAQRSSLVAFPEEIVTLRSGEFVGFTMRLVEGFRELHQLYGPRSRKIHYPNADFRFLVRAAANTARAIGQVHSSPCVIGDLNESGLLVSLEATVALIDADSFQLEADGKLYPCLVGKPDFTAPELHGRPLQRVVRTKEHDNFGLGVAIFQLLFMGRHPYAGQQEGSDLSLDQMIARNLFAYSRRRKTGVTPPGVLPSLDDFPSDIADGFERAFGLEPSRRPGAAEWVHLLQGLERQLSRCGLDQMHYYPSQAKQCPWCRMEASTGAVLFVSGVVAKAVSAVGLANFDVERAWLAVKAIVLPDPNAVVPKLPSFRPNASVDAKAAKSGSLQHKLVGGGVALAAISAWAYMPDVWLLWMSALIFAFFQFRRTGVDVGEWQRRYDDARSEWDRAVVQWRNALGIPHLARLRANIEAAVTEYRGLDAAKSRALARLNNERHSRQLNEYLDRSLIRRATISGIGPAKKTMLASFGVESAADVNRNALLKIPGFGPATADKLIAWRSQLERRFVYNPTPNQSDAAAQAKLNADFANKAAMLARQISGGQAELAQAANTLRVRLQIEDPRLTELAAARSQLEVDLAFLGVNKPATKAATPSSPVRTTPRSSPKPSPSPSPGAVLCPSCGARMVRRTAKRGFNRGNTFWGCSRYPRCRGTRP